MSKTAVILAQVVALAMLVFSAWMYQQTGDWVALVFMVGSMGYLCVFFLLKR